MRIRLRWQQAAPQATEPLIGRAKSDHRVDQCGLQSAIVSAPHAPGCAAGYNIRWLLHAIARLGLDGLFFAFWAVIAMRACVLKAVPSRTTLVESGRTSQRRPSPRLPWSPLVALG